MAAQRFDSIADTPHRALLNYIYDYAESADVTPESWATLYTMAAFTYGTIDPDTFISDRHQRFAGDPLAVFAGDVETILIETLRSRDQAFAAVAIRELAASPFWQARYNALYDIADLLGQGFDEIEELVLTKLAYDPHPLVWAVSREMISDESYQFYEDPHRAAEAFRLLVGAEAFRHPAPPTQA